MNLENLEIRQLTSIQEIPESAWQAIAPPAFPFMTYHFLRALETTGCLGERTGWLPAYITVWQGEELQGALVSFVKNNSYGEYIFDFAWADAHERMGLSYYPKLVSSVPFTPATGPKLLIRPQSSKDQRRTIAAALTSSFRQLGESADLSSSHALFLAPEEISDFEDAGFLLRHSYQYHWRDEGYESFDSFLNALKGKRRREIVRERGQVAASKVTVKKLTGAEVTAEHAHLFYRFYLDTVQKRGGFDYLTKEFFERVFSELREQILLVLAYDETGRTVAGALNYFGTDTLYGRHWGCLEDYKALHFEVCYYQGIEFAIERKFRVFEAGAQGEHKFHRGFLPTLTYSAHDIRDPQLAPAIADHIRREKMQIARLFQNYEEHSPFKASASSTCDAVK